MCFVWRHQQACGHVLFQAKEIYNGQKKYEKNTYTQWKHAHQKDRGRGTCKKTSWHSYLSRVNKKVLLIVRRASHKQSFEEGRGDERLKRFVLVMNGPLSRESPSRRRFCSRVRAPNCRRANSAESSRKHGRATTRLPTFSNNIFKFFNRRNKVWWKRIFNEHKKWSVTNEIVVVDVYTNVYLYVPDHWPRNITFVVCLMRSGTSITRYIPQSTATGHSRARGLV